MSESEQRDPLTYVNVASGASEDLSRAISAITGGSNSQVSLVCGGKSSRATAAAIDQLAQLEPTVVRAGSLEDSEALARTLQAGGFDVVVAVGGGGTIDVAKLASFRSHLPLLVLPTSLAHDGIASPVAVLTSKGRSDSLGAAPPDAVLVDIEIVRRGPPKLTRAGIGDVVSNLVAVRDWKLAVSVMHEPYAEAAAELAQGAARRIVNSAHDLGSAEFHRELALALIHSGQAMSIAGSSRPCSGGEHEISHAIDQLHPGLASHGSQVAVGTVFMAYLAGPDLLAEVMGCFIRYAVPTRPSEIGLSSDEFAAAVALAPSTRPERFTALEHRDMSSSELAATVGDFLDYLESS